MVIASVDRTKKILGGFAPIRTASLMVAWRACLARPLGIGDFRAWLACHEIKSRRCTCEDGRVPVYSFAELAKLLGVAERRARASVNRLVTAGLLEWSDQAIGFPDPPHEVDPALDDSIGGGRGSLAIPRRILRFLVAGGRPALIATVLGILLRCLSRRKTGFDGWGRVKASWIAGVFDVDLRRVKQARSELIKLGWIDPEPSGQCTENCHGRAFRIDLAWAAPRDPRSVPHTPTQGGSATLPRGGILTPPEDRSANVDGRRLPPLPLPQRFEIATPSSLHQEPLTERGENQEPGFAGPTGVGLKSSGEQIQLKVAPPDPQPVGPTPVPVLLAPKLADVRIEDLKDTARLLNLHGQAVARGLVGTSEADRLRFVGAAEHALAIATKPAALFAWLVLNGCWRYITGADEDLARRRLRLHEFGLPRVSAQPSPLALSSFRPIESGGLSEDARIVKAIREATIRAGIFRDPWPAFHARYPTWDRGRWDAALAELGL